MKWCRVALAVLLVTASLLSSLACAGVQQAAQKQREKNDLMQIGLEYHNYVEKNQKPPATLDEFVAFFEKTYGASPLTGDLKTGKYVIYLDVPLTNLPDGAVNTVLGYESSVPASGGPVVMADSTVREMTAADFAAAKKASGSGQAKQALNLGGMPMKCSFVAAALVVGLTAAGCTKGNPQTSGTVPASAKVNPAGPFPIVQKTVSMQELKQLGLFCQQFLLDGKGPAKLDDLNLKREAPALHQAIEEKRLILFWNVNLNNAPAGTSNTVLGYSAEVPTKGGAVLMLDGTARTMTAEEFAKAPKAGKVE